MLRLLYVNLNDRNLYYGGECSICNEKFIYKSKGVLRALFDKPLFDLDFLTHRAECINNRVMQKMGMK